MENQYVEGRRSAYSAINLNNTSKRQHKETALDVPKWFDLPQIRSKTASNLVEETLTQKNPIRTRPSFLTAKGNTNNAFITQRKNHSSNASKRPVRNKESLSSERINKRLLPNIRLHTPKPVGIDQYGIWPCNADAFRDNNLPKNEKRLDFFEQTDLELPDLEHQMGKEKVDMDVPVTDWCEQEQTYTAELDLDLSRDEVPESSSDSSWNTDDSDDEDNQGVDHSNKDYNPGNKGRNDLRKLRSYAESYLQRKLFKSWNFIKASFIEKEISLYHLEKALLSPSVKLNPKEMDRIFSMLKDSALGSVNSPQQMALPEKKKILIEYDKFEKLLYPKDGMAVAKWKAQLELEKRKLESEKARRERLLKELELKIFNRLQLKAGFVIRSIQSFNIHTKWKNESTRLRCRKQLLTYVTEFVNKSNKCAPNHKKRKSDKEEEDEILITAQNKLSASCFQKNLSISRLKTSLYQRFSKYGDLDGMSINDVAHSVHDFAAERIQLFVYACKKRQELELLEERQKFRQYQRKKCIFNDWKCYLKNIIALREHAYRVFIVWKKFTLKEMKYKTLFRLCFWPFFIWKRYLRRAVMARGKAKFLRKAFNTYITLHNFHVLVKKVNTTIMNRGRLNRFKQKYQKMILKRIVHHWNINARKRAKILKAWRLKGSYLQKYSKQSMMKACMFMWYYYHVIKSQIRRRKYVCFRTTVFISEYLEFGEAIRKEPPLLKIMETHIGGKIKRKSKIHELGVKAYSKYKKKDKKEIIGMSFSFRRLAPKVIRSLIWNIQYQKKNRLATEIGSLRLLYEHFNAWMSYSLYDNEGDRCSDGIDEQVAVTTEETQELHKLSWKKDIEWRLIGLQQTQRTQEKLSSFEAELKLKQHDRFEQFTKVEDSLHLAKTSEDIFLKEVKVETSKICARYHNSSAQLIRTRPRRLHDALVRVIKQVEESLYPQQLKSAFRSLRVPILYKKCTHLCNREKLKNWIQICHKYRTIQNNIDKYYYLKKIWQTWKKWIRYVDRKLTYETPGLCNKIKRQQVLLKRHDKFLIEKDIINTSVFKSKDSVSNSFHGTFLRWLEFTQLSINRSKIISFFRQRTIIRSKVRVFDALLHKDQYKTKISSSVKQNSCFPILRFSYDILRIQEHILNFSKHLHSHRVRRVFSWIIKNLKRKGCSTPNIKVVLKAHREEVKQRLFLENRLMFVSYNDRGTHYHKEHDSDMVGSEIGTAFRDEVAGPYCNIREIMVISTKQIDSLQIIRSSFESQNTTFGDLRGSAFGDRQRFVLSNNERVVFVEGYSSKILTGIRFQTNKQRYSKWYGQKEEGCGSQYFSFSPDAFKYKESTEIIGFFGFCSESSINGFGVTFRETTHENVFAGKWLQDSTRGVQEEDLQKCDEQFAYFLQLRACVVERALTRTHRFAIEIWRLPEMPDSFSSLPIVVRLAEWLFNALTFGLVKLPEKENEGKDFLQKGLNLRAKGEDLVLSAANILSTVKGYKDGKCKLSIAVYGRKTIEEMKAKIKLSKLRNEEGNQLILEGDELATLGKSMMPMIPLHNAMRKHIQELYDIVKTREYIEKMDDSLKQQLLNGDNDKIVVPKKVSLPKSKEFQEQFLQNLSDVTKGGFEGMIN